MKEKILLLFNNPIAHFVAMGLFFLFASIDVQLISYATSLSEMTWFGKICVGGFTLILGLSFIRFFFLPIINYLNNLFK